MENKWRPSSLEDLHRRYDGPIPEHEFEAARRRYPPAAVEERGIVTCAIEAAREQGTAQARASLAYYIAETLPSLSKDEAVKWLYRLAEAASEYCERTTAHELECRRALAEAMK